MSVNTFSKRTEIDLRSIQLRSILVWTAPSKLDESEIDVSQNVNARMRTEIDLKEFEIDLSPKRSECERSYANWDRSGINLN